ncbi:MAG: DUF423 domain-containing protein [Saprospiraceae bacterium]|nr:DUF423 domain-containing protein [Saprospiraceae bacterium]MBK8825582.1 DUF423 domain-containing protein [Saprospiraceae bacterium]MBK9582899.1 DUF423 domain-containing protein [Saprospiraceae bacterium]
MDNKIKIVAILGALGVGIGAFGAHGLKPYLDVAQTETFKTATLYHFIHIVAMLTIAMNSTRSKVNNLSFYLFLAGVVCFSGSLYILSTRHLYGGDTWNFVGPITPIGGLLFIFGWLNLLRVKHN